MKCKACGCWLAPEWLIRAIEYGALVVVVVVACLALGCSTKTFTSPEGARITSTTFIQALTIIDKLTAPGKLGAAVMGVAVP